MTIQWEGEDVDRIAAIQAAEDLIAYREAAQGPGISIANEFAEVEVFRAETRNGARLVVTSPRSGQWVTLCPLELESLTWQTPETFSAMIGKPFAPLFESTKTNTEGKEDGHQD